MNIRADWATLGELCTTAAKSNAHYRKWLSFGGVQRNAKPQAAETHSALEGDYSRLKHRRVASFFFLLLRECNFLLHYVAPLLSLCPADVVRHKVRCTAHAATQTGSLNRNLLRSSKRREPDVNPPPRRDSYWRAAFRRSQPRPSNRFVIRFLVRARWKPISFTLKKLDDVQARGDTLARLMRVEGQEVCVEEERREGMWSFLFMSACEPFQEVCKVRLKKKKAKSDTAVFFVFVYFGRSYCCS